MTLYTNELKERGVKKMEKKNIMFTKEGMKVGVKEVKDEDYADATQRYLHRIPVFQLGPSDMLSRFS